MAGPLDLRGRVVITDGATGVLTKIRNGLASIGGATTRATRGLPSTGAVGGAITTAAMYSFINATKEFNQSVWGAQAAFLGDVTSKTAEGMTEGLEKSRLEAERLRRTALDLSKTMGIMPETFMKAGEEAAKMGLSMSKSQAVMKASGLVEMSDREAQANVMAKALGTYGIIYGAEEDDAKYAEQVKRRASMLALAGAQTRTSASKIEEGMRNYMGIHGAFGGRFEDAVALIAAGTNSGMLEKEAGTALKSLNAKIINMGVPGRSALAGAGIDVSKFMDFGAVDPLRATNQLIQMFPQSLGKGARGKLLKFLENERATGGLSDPSIINKTIRQMERLGLKFAGDQDRENASNKIASVMSGVGGRYDPLALIKEIEKAISEGRAGPNIWQSLGEPKRIHQNLQFMKMLNDTIKIRNALLEDGGRYLDLVQRGFALSDAGKIVALEASFRRLQVTLMRSDGVQAALEMFNKLASWFESLPPGAANLAGSLLALGGIASVVGIAFGGIVMGLTALATPIGLTLAAVVGLGSAFVLFGGQARSSIASMTGAMGEFADNALDGLSTGIDKVQQKWGQFSSWVGGWVDGIKSRVSWLVDMLGGLWGRLSSMFSIAAVAAPAMAGQPVVPQVPASGSVPSVPASGAANNPVAALRAQLAAVDLTAEGQRIMSTLEAGIRSGTAGVLGAMDQAVAGIRERAASAASAGRVNLNTGPTMSGAR